MLQTQAVALWGKEKSVVDVVVKEDPDGFYPGQVGGSASHCYFPSLLQQQRSCASCLCQKIWFALFGMP
jgi:hypothetical protein